MEKKAEAKSERNTRIMRWFDFRGVRTYTYTSSIRKCSLGLYPDFIDLLNFCYKLSYL
jgi:hypothetical protein